MSGASHKRARRTDSSVKPAEQKQPSARHERPAKPDAPALAGEVSAIGNAGLNQLLGKRTGKSLDSNLQARLEHAFGTRLDDVRVRDDSAAWQATQSVDAQALATGEDIYLGPDAPAANSPEAAPLIAHEVAHVLQQRNADSIEDRLDDSGDAHETAAESAAQQAMQAPATHAGGPVGAVAKGGKTGGVAGVQRQRRGATREQVEAALRNFLNRVLSVRPTPDLRRSRVVRNALDTLVRSGGPSAMFVNVDDFIQRVPNDPVEFARRFAHLLPPTIDPSALQRLEQLATVDSQQGSAGSRVIDLFSSTQAGGSEPPTDPQRVSPADRDEQMAATMRRWRGVDEPTTVGPISVDIPQMGRFFGGLGGALHPPTPQAPAPTGRNYPDVEAAIARIPQDALVPAEARGREAAASFAGAREFARELARQLDVAQQRNQDTITINLGDNYAQVHDRRAMTAAVESIIAQIRAALPHHATNVINVDVMAGQTWLTRGRPRATP